MWTDAHDCGMRHYMANNSVPLNIVIWPNIVNGNGHTSIHFVECSELPIDRIRIRTFTAQPQTPPKNPSAFDSNFQWK